MQQQLEETVVRIEGIIERSDSPIRARVLSILDSYGERYADDDRITYVLTYLIDEFQAEQNVLLIIADDLGVDATPGFAPFDAIKAPMPHIEELIKEGVRFSSAWSSPVCAPTRAGILTGKYGFRTGIDDRTTQIGADENIIFI